MKQYRMERIEQRRYVFEEKTFYNTLGFKKNEESKKISFYFAWLIRI